MCMRVVRRDPFRTRDTVFFRDICVRVRTPWLPQVTCDESRMRTAATTPARGSDSKSRRSLAPQSCRMLCCEIGVFLTDVFNIRGSHPNPFLGYIPSAQPLPVLWETCQDPIPAGLRSVPLSPALYTRTLARSVLMWGSRLYDPGSYMRATPALR